MKNARLLLILGLASGAMLGCSSPVHRAILHHDLVRLRALLDSGANPNNYVHSYGQPLSLSATLCDADSAKMLLANGAETGGAWAELALRTAVESCEADLVELLLKAGVSPNAKYYLGPTVLSVAVKRERLDIVSILLDYRADPNLRGNFEGLPSYDVCEAYPLLLAAKAGSLGTVTLLVERGARLNVRDESGATALSLALEAGNDEIVRFLRSKGAT